MDVVATLRLDRFLGGKFPGRTGMRVDFYQKNASFTRSGMQRHLSNTMMTELFDNWYVGSAKWDC